MKKLEIIRRIVEEDPTQDIIELFYNSIVYNLSLLCFKNKKYLTDENLKLILSNKKMTIKKLNSMDYASDKMKYSNLALLISTYPELLNSLNKKYIEKLNVNDWVKIIQDQPELFNICSITNKFRYSNWIEILSKQPQLVVNYNDFYKNIEQHDLRDIAKSNKNILNYIDPNKIEINNYIFPRLIIYNPIIIEKFDKERIKHRLNKIISPDWLLILKEHPQLIDICPKIDVIKKYLFNDIPNLIDLVIKQPKFKYLLPTINILDDNSLNQLAKKLPELIDELNIDVKSLQSRALAEIIANDIKYVEKYNIDFKIFKEDDWYKILEKQPNLIDKCDVLYKINNHYWDEILNNQPQLIDYYIKVIDEKSEKYRLSYDLLLRYPDYIEKLDKRIDYNLITEDFFNNLVYNSKKYQLKIMEKYAERFHSSKVLTNMINLYPDLKDLYTEKDLWKYVDFNQLTENLEYIILK